MKHAKLLLIGVGAVAGLLLLVKGRNAAVAVGQALNPLSDQNLAYKGASGLGNWLAGDGQDLPLGVRIYDAKEKADAERAALGVSDWMLWMPPVAIGTAIGGYLKNQLAPTTPKRTSDADAQFPYTFTDPYGGTWA